MPGRSLAGVRLGEKARQVEAALGRFHGVCRGCRAATWYFTYQPFERHGLAVELTRGRVSAVYTLWRPRGWHGPHGIRFGMFDGALTSKLGPLVVVDCSGFRALVADTGTVRTAYDFVDGRLWAFGLFRAGADPCR